MYSITPKSARRADSFFIFLPDGSRLRVAGSFPITLGDTTFKNNEKVIRASGCTVVQIDAAPSEPVSATPVVEEVVAPVEVSSVPAPVEAPAVEETAVESTPEVTSSVEPTEPEEQVEPASDVESTEEKVTRRRRSKSVE
jgi:hypothetical protein